MIIGNINAVSPITTDVGFQLMISDKKCTASCYHPSSITYYTQARCITLQLLI